MKIESLKLDIIQWIAGTDDEKLLKTLSSFKKATEDTDWWDSLTPAQIKGIREGLKILTKEDIFLINNFGPVMASGRNIRWSRRATKDTVRIIKYLSENWSEREVDKFREQLKKFTDVVTAFPDAFPQSRKSELRKAVISKHNSVLYRVKKHIIEVAMIIDNRSDHPY